MPGASRTVRPWLPSMTPYRTAAATSQRSAPAARARRRCSQPTRRTRSPARRARCSVCGSAKAPIRHARGERASSSPAATATLVRPASWRTTTTVRPAASAQEDRREEVHPQRRLAQRRHDERGDPAQDHVGREAGRVGHPQERRHGLELAGVPESLAGQEHAPGQGEGHDPDEDGRRRIEQDGDGPAPRPRPARRRRSPAERPGPGDAPCLDRHRHPDQPDHGRQPPRSRRPARAEEALRSQRHRDEKERREVEAEAIAELDPALAEVHQVDHPDRQGGEERPGHAPVAQERAGPAGRGGTPGWRGGRSSPPGAARATSSRRRSTACVARPGRRRHQVGEAEQHEPQVLGDVAQVLQRPGAVVAEIRVGDHLVPVERLVDGVEERPGCGQRVGRAGRRSGSPCPIAAPARRRPAAAGPDQQQEREAEGDRQPARRGQAQEDPRGDLAGIARSGRGRRRVAGRLALLAASSARPTAASVRPTATTWAKYQVVPSDAAYHRAVPAPMKTVSAMPDERAGSGAGPASRTPARRPGRR